MGKKIILGNILLLIGIIIFIGFVQGVGSAPLPTVSSPEITKVTLTDPQGILHQLMEDGLTREQALQYQTVINGKTVTVNQMVTAEEGTALYGQQRKLKDQIFTTPSDVGQNLQAPPTDDIEGWKSEKGLGGHLVTG